MSKKEKKVSFEEALKRLEEIVETMESGEVDLDRMVESFEEGQNLVKLCTDKLNEVEAKIEKIIKNAPEGAVVEDFEIER
jgi:exodeoxyribonuclease VII small subunit